MSMAMFTFLICFLGIEVPIIEFREKLYRQFAMETKEGVCNWRGFRNISAQILDHDVSIPGGIVLHLQVYIGLAFLSAITTSYTTR